MSFSLLESKSGTVSGRARRVLSFVPLPLILSTLCMTACAPQSNGGAGNSRVSIQIPNVDHKPASLSVGSQYDFSRACFAINVRAADIPPAVPSNPAKCDVQIGLFSGFAAPGQTLSVNVPRGNSRTLEVFTFLRDSAQDKCPTQSHLSTLPRNKVVRVGLVPSFRADSDSLVLEVQLSAPSSSDNLISQYQLASSCVISPPKSRFTAGIVSGQGILRGGNYILDANFTGTSNEQRLSGGVYHIVLTRRPD